MIINCEECQTRFQVDEGRLPSGGARLRCSKCQHAFFVRLPEVEAETAVQGIVADAVEEAIPVPEPEAAAGHGQTAPGLSSPLEPMTEIPPEEWTFNEDPPGNTASPVSQLGQDPTDLGMEFDPEAPADLFGAPGDLGSSATFRSRAGPSAPDSAPEPDASAVGHEEPALSFDLIGGDSEGVELAPTPFPATDPDAAAVAASDGSDSAAAVATSDGSDSAAAVATSDGSDSAAAVATSDGSDSAAAVATSDGSDSAAAVATSDGSDSAAALRELGDPTEWDFLADSFPADSLLADSGSALGEESHAPELVVEAPETPTAVETPRRRRPRPWFLPERPAEALAWVLAAVVTAGGLLQVVQGMGRAPVHALVPVTSAPGTPVADRVRARSLENLHLGSILVIEGVLAAGTPGEAVRVRLLDAAGEPLPGAAAWAGPALPDSRLRQEDPAELRARLSRGAAGLVAGGSFHAVFLTVPRQARAVAFAGEPAPTLRATSRPSTPPRPDPSSE